MGITFHAASFLLAARATGARFDRVLTIGRQRLYVHPGSLRQAFAEHRISLSHEDAARLLQDAGGFAEPLLRRLGAREVDSLDRSGYEGCSIEHDLNEPVPDDLAGRFSLVLDSGALEHVFDFPMAVANCMRMCALDGHVLMASPANGEMGHGFYQFSPELLYRTFTDENGFRMEQLLARELRPRSRWYAVADPAGLGSRVVARSARPLYLYVKARRVADVVPFRPPPQQSDYRAAWEAPRSDVPTEADDARESGRVRAAIRRRLPLWALPWVDEYRERPLRLKRGPYREPGFRRIDMSDLPPR